MAKTIAAPSQLSPLPLPTARLRRWLWLYPALAALAASPYILIKTGLSHEPGYPFYFLIPACYGGFMLLTRAMRTYCARPSLFFMNIFMFIRYVAVPVLVAAFSAYSGRGVAVSVGNLEEAVWLTLYELATLFLGIAMLAPLLLKDPHPELHFKTFRPARGQLITPLVILAGMLLLLANKDLADNFHFFLNAVAAPVEPALKNVSSRGEGGGPVFMLASCAKLLLSLYIINGCKARYDQTGSFRHVLMAMVAFLPNLLFTIQTSRNSIVIPSVAGVLLFNVLFPAHRKRTAMLMLSAILAIFVYITLHKNFNADQDHQEVAFNPLEFAATLQGYGSTTRNLAFAIRTQERSGSFMNFPLLCNDLLDNVPGLSRFAVKGRTSTALFNGTYYGEVSSLDQILPLVGQGYIHWGFLLAPIYSLPCVWFLLFLDKLALQEYRPEVFFLLTMAIFKFSSVWMANLNIAMSYLTETVLPLFILMYLNRLVSPSSRKNQQPKPPPPGA